jgi:UDP:flavonoid glycosyltransferase YjiC (YdhE family)
MYDAYLTGKWSHGPMGIGLAARRIHKRALLDGAAARLVACLPELDPAGSARRPDNLHYTGPVVSGVPATPTEPTVLVSLSTINFPGQARAMQNILDALGTLEVRGIATVGPSIGIDNLVAPSNVELRGFVPHDQLLPTVSMVVGHGGHATTMVALAHDLPVLVMPMHPMLDQKMVGQSLVDTGAGLLMSKKAESAAIAEAVTELLGTGAHRAAAARLGATIRATPGAIAGADLVSAVAENGIAATSRAGSVSRTRAAGGTGAPARSRPSPRRRLRPPA